MESMEVGEVGEVGMMFLGTEEQSSTTFSSDSVVQEPTSIAENPKNQSEFLRTCRWKGCTIVAEDMLVFYNHLHDHAAENLAGPCQWDECGSGANGGRLARHRCRYMELHIVQHIPKKSFHCFMEGCQKAFDSPSDLNLHVSKHQQPKKVISPIVRDPEEPKIPNRLQEFPISVINAAGQRQLMKLLKAQDVLRSLGICFVSLTNEYFVTVHGLPDGILESNTVSFEKKYSLRFPYAPNWMKELYIRCKMSNSESRHAVLTWKLPLSNPVFCDPLRLFVKAVEKEFCM